MPVKVIYGALHPSTLRLCPGPTPGPPATPSRSPEPGTVLPMVSSSRRREPAGSKASWTAGSKQQPVLRGSPRRHRQVVLKQTVLVRHRTCPLLSEIKPAALCASCTGMTFDNLRLSALTEHQRGVRPALLHGSWAVMSPDRFS